MASKQVNKQIEQQQAISKRGELSQWGEKPARSPRRTDLRNFARARDEPSFYRYRGLADVP